MALNDFFATKPKQTTRSLTQYEQQELARLRQIVAEGLAKCFEVGFALKTIRDRQLYRDDAKTFEEFCLTAFRLTERRAYQLIAAAEVATNLNQGSADAPAPTSERQVRPLTSLSPADQVDAWTEATELAGNQAPTAAQVETAVRKRRPMKKKATRQKPIRYRVPGGTVTIVPNKSFTSAEEVLQAALRKLRGDSSDALTTLEATISQARGAA